MRKKILGWIGVAFGLGVALYSFTSERGDGPFGMEQAAGTIIGVVILIASIIALVTARLERKRRKR